MGYFIDITKPKEEDITLVDIAHRLSNICRFGGECKRFYSVAEHSVFVLAQLADKTDEPNLLKAALLHDSAEAYVGDIVDIPAALYKDETLVQTRRNVHKRLEHIVRDVIFEKFGLPVGPMPDVIDEIDKRCCLTEAQALLPSQGYGLGWNELRAKYNPYEDRAVMCLGPRAARDLFLCAADRLGIV